MLMGQAALPHEGRNLVDLANHLTALADGLRSGKDDTVPPPQGDSNGSPNTKPSAEAIRAHHLTLAKQAYADRRRRETILGNSDLFGEPAWDILLDLYIAQGNGQEVSVSSACIGSAAPATTGLRWLGVLQETGLVRRINDDQDHRRVLVQLSAEGLARMEQYLSEVAGPSKPKVAMRRSKAQSNTPNVSEAVPELQPD